MITIGHQSYLLPDDTGAAALVKTLSRAVACDYYFGREIRMCPNPSVDVSMTYVKPGTPIEDADGNRLASKPKSQPNHSIRKLRDHHAPQLGWRDDQRLL